MLSERASGWATQQLSEIARIVTGKTPSTKDDRFWNGEVPFVTPSDIGASPWCDTVERHLSDLGASTVSTAPAGAVLFTCIASIGKSCILSGRSAFNQQINACIPGPSTDTYFLYSQLQAMADEIRHLAGTTAVPIINKSTFSTIPISFPPLDEQRRIADVLRSVDEAIATAQSIADQVQTVWHGLTERLIWDRLEQNADLARPLGNALKGSDYGVNASLGSEPVGHAILRMGNLQDGYIDPTDLKWAEIAEADAEVLALDVGDILFNRTNSRDLVGKVALVREPTDFLYASYIVRLRVNQSVADPYYLFAVMHSRRAQAQFKSIATPGVSQSNINPTNLKKQVIPLPSLAEQRDIAAQLQSVEAVRRTAVDELVTLRQIKSDLMTDLLSGRVRVPE